MLVEGLLGVVRDELDHAERSRAVHALAGGTPMEVRIDRSWLALTVPGDTLERRAAFAALAECALHESFALEAFREMRGGPLLPAVRAAIDPIFQDEARHRRLGWRLLEALLERTGERDWLRGQSSAVLASVDALYSTRGAAEDEEAGWGLLDAAAYRRARARAARTIGPRMRRLGLA